MRNNVPPAAFAATPPWPARQCIGRAASSTGRAVPSRHGGGRP